MHKNCVFPAAGVCDAVSVTVPGEYVRERGRKRKCVREGGEVMLMHFVYK